MDAALSQLGAVAGTCEVDHESRVFIHLPSAREFSVKPLDALRCGIIHCLASNPPRSHPRTWHYRMADFFIVGFSSGSCWRISRQNRRIGLDSNRQFNKHANESFLDTAVHLDADP
jgi:hypothetical protein